MIRCRAIARRRWGRIGTGGLNGPVQTLTVIQREGDEEEHAVSEEMRKHGARDGVTAGVHDFWIPSLPESGPQGGY